MVALVAPHDVDAHGDRLVGLVGDDDALAHLRAAGAVLGRVIGLGRGLRRAHARPAWSWCARGSGAARRRCARGAPCARRRAPRPASAPRGLARARCDARSRRSRRVVAAGAARRLLRARPRRRRLGAESPAAGAAASVAAASVGLGRLRPCVSSVVSGVSSGVSAIVDLSSRLSRSGRRRAGGPRSAPARGRAWRARMPAVFSSSPVAGCRRRPNTSRRAVAMCSRSLSSERSRSSEAFITARPLASRTWSSRAACGRPGASPRARAARGTPESSNITRPGLTTATQPSGLPLPEPMRVSAGFFVKGLSGKTLIHTLPPRLILRVMAIRAASIWRLVSQPVLEGLEAVLAELDAAAGRARGRARRPRCWRRNLTRFGDSISG